MARQNRNRHPKTRPEGFKATFSPILLRLSYRTALVRAMIKFKEELAAESTSQWSDRDPWSFSNNALQIELPRDSAGPLHTSSSTSLSDTTSFCWACATGETDTFPWSSSSCIAGHWRDSRDYKAMLWGV